MISPGRPSGALACSSAASSAAILAVGGAQVRLLLVDGLRRRGAGFQQHLIALQIGQHFVARRLRRRAGWPRPDGDFGRLGGVLQIGELIPGLLKQPGRLIDRIAIVGVVLFEQRRALDHAIAALDANGGDETLLGRPDLDEIGVGVTLPFLGAGRPGAKKDPPQRAERQRDTEKDDDSTIHRGRARVGSGSRALLGRRRLRPQPAA